MIFVLALLALLDSLSGGHAQTCTWNEAATTYKRAAGASLTFTLTVAGEDLTDADRITWKLGSADLVVLRYHSLTFTQISDTNGATAVSQRNSHSLTISSLPIGYNAQNITVISGGCTVNDVSNVIILDVRNGNLESFQPEAYAIDQSDCTSNCVREFRCYRNGDFTFKATWQADATWTDVEYDTRNTAAYVLMALSIIFTCVLVAVAVFSLWKNDPTVVMQWFHVACIIISSSMAVVNIIVVAIPQGPYCTPERIYGGIAMASLSLTFSLVSVGVHAAQWIQKPVKVVRNDDNVP